MRHACLGIQQINHAGPSAMSVVLSRAHKELDCTHVSGAPQWTDNLQRALGKELRTTRRLRSCTLEGLHERLAQQGVEISVQALATYEMGTRTCSVVRLVEWAYALGMSKQELLQLIDRTLERLEHARAGVITVDLAAIVHAEEIELRPLRRWARMYRTDARRHQVLHLDDNTIKLLATACRTSVHELASRLRAYGPTASSVRAGPTHPADE